LGRAATRQDIRSHADCRNEEICRQASG
jgi:hypothetical protein